MSAFILLALVTSCSALRLGRTLDDEKFGGNVKESEVCSGKWTMINELRPPSGQTPKTAKVCIEAMEQKELGESFVRELPKLDVSPTASPEQMKKLLWVIITGAAEDNTNPSHDDPGGCQFRNRVIPSAETWLTSAAENSVVAVFADGNKTRKVLADANCGELVEVNVGSQRFLEARCPTKAQPVIALIVPCSFDGGHDAKHYGDGPCCKYDSALSYIETHVGRHSLQDPDWVWIGDDDVYARMPQLTKVLSHHDATDSIMLNPDGTMYYKDANKAGTITHTGWNKQVKDCNKDAPQAMYYSMISKGLRTKLVNSIADGKGLAKTCAAAGGAYDTTAGLWAWKHGAKFLPFAPYTNPQYYEPTSRQPWFVEHMIVHHGVRGESTFQTLHGDVGHIPMVDRKLPLEASDLQQVDRDYGWFDSCKAYLD